MNFSDSAKAVKLWFDEDSMWMNLEDGRVISVPKTWFPKLLYASDEELNNYEMSGNGIAVHWEQLDEDIYVQNLLLGYGAVQKKGLAS